MTLAAIIPSCLLFACAPIFFFLWIPFRIVKSFFPKCYFFVDEKLYSIYQRSVLFFYENWAGTKIVLYGDTDYLKKGKENVLYMSNHLSAVDWAIADMLAARQGGIGRIRYILKEELKYVPMYGFYFNEHGSVYVNRRQFQQSRAVKQLQSIRENENECWMVIFPEGTRLCTKKLDLLERSRDFAKKSGLKPLDFHLTPRVRGSQLVVETLGNYLDAVYDVTILYSGCVTPDGRRTDAPQLFSFFAHPNVIHIHLRRIPMAEVPASDDAFRAWLHDRFVEKDKMIGEGLKKDLANGLDVFGDAGTVSPLPLSQTLPSLLFLLSFYIPLLLQPSLLCIFGLSCVGIAVGGLLYSFLCI